MVGDRIGDIEMRDDVGERLHVGGEDIVNREIRDKYELNKMKGQKNISEVIVDGTTSINGHNRRIHGSLGTNEFAHSNLLLASLLLAPDTLNLTSPNHSRPQTHTSLCLSYTEPGGGDH